MLVDAERLSSSAAALQCRLIHGTMWPPRWISRLIVRHSRSCTCALLLGYLSLLGLLSFQLVVVNSTKEISSSSAVADFVDTTDAAAASSFPLRKHSEVLLLGSPATLTHIVHPRSNIVHDISNPFFDNTTAINVTTEIATTAYLHCRVHQLGDKMVSWLRRRDFNILTVGLLTYSSDQRFQMLHQDHTNDWTLQIKYTQGRDAGVYECQVSSDPPISHFVNLNVVVAKAEIVGATDMYFKSGSTITLTCLITQSPDPPAFVFWYHDNRMINYDTSRGGITVTTENGDTTVSTVVITNAQRTDSGNYTCGPANADPTSVTVHVLNGEKPEAIQHDAKTSNGHRAQEMTRCLLIVVLLVVIQHSRIISAR